MKYIQGMIAVFALVVMMAAGWAQTGANKPIELPYSIQHHEFKADINLDRHYLTAHDRIALKREIRKPEQLTLLLRRGLTIESVQVGEEKLQFRTTQDVDPYAFETFVDSEDVAYYRRSQEVVISLPEGIAREKEIALEIAYQGVIQDSAREADFSREYVTDQISGVLDLRGIYLGPEAIFYPALPAQLFTFSAEMTIPARFQCVSEGILKETQVSDGIRTETWVCEQPMDAFHIVGGQYQVDSLAFEGVQISTYFYPEEMDLSPRYLTVCRDYIALYNNLLGLYPYGKFAVVDNFFATGYGMPSFTLLGSTVLRLPWILSTSLGHEICHNWWGNSVYVNYELGNWCEGLTVYCADYLYKERESFESARQYRIDLLRDYTAYTNERNDFPLTEFRERHNPAQRAVGYGKSAMVFHMLRSYIGHDDFWRALKRFYRDNIWSHASWEDVRKAFEKESAIGLKWFFEQWIERAGAPVLEIEAPQKSRTEGAWELALTLRQTQEGEPYILEVPIVVRGFSQEAHLRTGSNRQDQRVTLRTIFEPVSFTVDPGFDLFRRLDRREVAPTLAEVLGAERLMVVLPGLASPELQEAYREVARQLIPHGADQLRIVRDDEVGEGDLQSSSLLFLGTPEENRAIPPKWIINDRWRLQSESYWLLGEEHTDPHAAFLAVERHHDNSDLSIGFFCARTASDAREAGGKLRHYGKYSYLIFSGGKNVVKGQWEVSESPLTYYFTGE